MMKLTRGALLAATMLATPPIVAQAPAGFDAAKAFGAREDVTDVSISPDGSTLALVRSQGPRGAAVDIVPVAGGAPKRILGSAGDPDHIRNCQWSTNTRLLCNLYIITDLGDGQQGFTRRIAVDSDGKNLQLLSARDSKRALGVVGSGGSIIDQLPDDDGSAVLMTRYIVPEENSQGTRITEDRQGLSVERVDTVTLKRKPVEPARIAAAEYISDGHGTVRIIGQSPPGSGGYANNFLTYSYRKPGSRDWLPLGKLTFVNGHYDGFNPVAVDRDLNVVYGFEQTDGRNSLYKIALDGSMKRDLVYSKPGVDVDGLVRIGRQRRVVGVSYATDKRTTEFFDPELKRQGASLSKALPHLPIVSFVDANHDESKLVLFAGSDDNPGQFYLFDKKAKSLSEIMPVRPLLDKIKLGNKTPMSYPAADGTSIPGYLTLPPGAADLKGLPAIVLPHGGPDAREEWDFDWLSQYFANRGFAVLQPNFRGSTGYGADFFRDNGFKSWKTAIGDVDDAGRWLVKQGADAGKLAIFGWSYGGYAALQSGVFDPGLFKAIVAVAPVTDLRSLREASINYANYQLVKDQIGDGPHLTEGSPAQNAGKITVPVLMFQGDRDQNLPPSQAKFMEAKLKAANKPVELVWYTKLDHQLDDSAVRAEMLAKSDAFLRKTMGM